jgi:hypothetical protein
MGILKGSDIMKVSRDGNVLIFKASNDVEITRIRMKNEQVAQRKLAAFVQLVFSVHDYGPWADFIHNMEDDYDTDDVSSTDNFLVVNPHERRVLSMPRPGSVESYLKHCVQDYPEFDIRECKVYDRENQQLHFAIELTSDTKNALVTLLHQSDD